MLMPTRRLFNHNMYRFQSCTLYRTNLPVVRSVMRPKSCFSRNEAEKLKDKGCDIIMNMRQPYRTLLIFLVGKAHCAEAVENIREMAFCLARLLSRQCKVHTSQKVHRSLQLYSCYLRMWGEELTHKMISGLRKSLMITGKTILISAVCMAPYDWEKNKIPDEKLQSCIEEYEIVDALCNATVYCEECHERQVVDRRVPNVKYCMCKGSIGYTDRSRQFDSWEAFLERENILVWKKKHQVHTHLYSYKVYGTYDDTSLSAFLETQLNPLFRKQWDSTALELKVINSHPESNSDLLYWLVEFPHFFANRDYVFKRRFEVNEQKKEVVIVNEIVAHPQVPESKGIHRVKEYWSIMVLRAKDSYNKPGMSYTLTYFDNPGTSLPSAVTSFVASTAFPDFLKRVHGAAISLQRRWENGEDVYVSLPPCLRRRTKLKADSDLPRIKPDIGAVISLEESDETVTSKWSEESLKSPNNEFEEDFKENHKIHLRYRKVVINLLEAIEVVSPEYEEKTAVTAKVEALVDKLGLNKSEKHLLVRRLETLRNRTKMFMKDAAKKKDSITMNEFERGNYDDQSPKDEPTLLIFIGLLQAINDVLKADKDMKTGKGFAETDETLSLETKPPLKEKGTNSCGMNECSSENYNPGNNFDQLKPIVALCECCECDSLIPKGKDGSINPPWYHFAFVSSWWGTKSSVEKQGKSFCQTCTCEHKVRKEGGTISGNNANNLSANESPDGESSWLYHLRVIFGYTSTNSAKSNDSNEADKPDNSQANVEDKGKESLPWYFLLWLSKLWTRA